MTFNCDICNESASMEVPHCREYTNGQRIDICSHCGFVYTKERRTSQEIADSWSNEIFSSDFTKKTYTARIPAVVARHAYVSEFIDQNIGFKEKSVCDIGAGEGAFLSSIRKNYHCASVFGIEPSEKNNSLMQNLDIPSFCGTAEGFKKSAHYKTDQFDIVTAMWTLVNSSECKKLTTVAHEIVKPGGYLVVAEGSRILVPFKKPLHMYFSTLPVDVHPFHFSANAMKNLLRLSGFEIVKVNSYIDTDYLVIIARKTASQEPVVLEKDSPQAVSHFFERWHAETKLYY